MLLMNWDTTAMWFQHSASTDKRPANTTLHIAVQKRLMQ